MKRFTKFVVESIEEADLDEAVEVRHDRYLRSHGKKARDSFGGGGTWAFTHKDRGDVDYNNDKEVYKHSGKFADAKKAAQQWGKKHGHREVYVMESIELDENIAGLFKDASEWEKSAKARGLVVKPATHPSGEATKYHIAKDKQGNNRGHFDHGTKTGRLKEEVDLDEVSASTLRSYVDKAKEDKTRQQKARTVAKSDAKKYGLASDKGRADAAHRKVGQRGTGISIAQKKLGMYPKDRAQPKVMAREEVDLDEVSDKKLDAYRQKAFADQPSGDDGSDKYRKRKFGRDLAFAKQTGRAKVLATKEEVELDESVNDMVRVGQKMIELAPKEKNDMISNAYSKLGDALTRYGTPFGPKNVADLEKKTGMNQRIIVSLIKKVQQ